MLPEDTQDLLVLDMLWKTIMKTLHGRTKPNWWMIYLSGRMLDYWGSDCYGDSKESPKNFN